MIKNKTLERLMRFLVMLLGAGLGAALAALIIPLLKTHAPGFMSGALSEVWIYAALCLLGAAVLFALSGAVIRQIMKLMAGAEKRWDSMSASQIILTSVGLIIGLIVAALLTRLILAAGTSLITVTCSAIIYLLCGFAGSRLGYRRYKEVLGLREHLRRRRSKPDTFDEPMSFEADEPEVKEAGASRKLLDTSVIIDGRIMDVARTGFIEGDIIVPQFVLAELRHIADSGDALRRARGRRGLDVLQKLQRELGARLIVDETDYSDAAEVDVKLLRLCREKGGVVVTNDYNLNKVAGVTGIRVLNINDLANAVKPMLMAGEELTVQVVREGKEPGQGVAYLDDGTMIVVENGRRSVGESVTVIVTTVLQTSAGRMIFSKLKGVDEKAG